jgi:hypothetical protein
MICLPALSGATEERSTSRPAATRHVALDKSCSMEIKDPWSARNGKPDKSTSYLLDFVIPTDNPDHIDAHLAVFTKQGQMKDLGAFAESTIEHVRPIHPDQHDFEATRISLDGSEAQRVEYRMQIAGHETRVIGVVTNHDGKIYIIEYYCEADEWEKHKPACDEMIRSFKWKSADAKS